MSPSRYERTYLAHDLIVDRERYFYSTVDRDTVADFLTARAGLRAAVQQRLSYARSEGIDIHSEAFHPYACREDLSVLDLETLLRRFCATKRAWTAYETDWRPTASARFDDLGAYVWLAGLFAGVFAASSDLRFLNALLQLHDIIQSRAHHLDGWQLSSILGSLDVETRAITNLGQVRTSGPRTTCE